MDILINEINKTLRNNCWLAALSLALSIPDICGQIEYSEITGKGAVGERYKKWYKAYVEKEYTFNDQIIFSAEHCYALRCSFFHSGNNKINSRMLDMFQFSVPDPNNYSSFNSYCESDILGKRLTIDIAQLSHVLVLEATAWKASTSQDLSSLKEFSFFNPSTFYYSDKVPI